MDQIIFQKWPFWQNFDCVCLDSETLISKSSCIKIVRHGGDNYFSKKQLTHQDCFLQVLPSREEWITGIQLPVLAPQDLKHHPYLWNHWCCSCPGHKPTHRWAVGSGHHTVLLAGPKVCGSLSGFEEKQLCEKRWKQSMVNSVAPALEELGGSAPGMQDMPWQVHCTEHFRPPTCQWQTSLPGSAWLCAQVHKRWGEGKLFLRRFLYVLESTALVSRRRGGLPFRMRSAVSSPCSPGAEGSPWASQCGVFSLSTQQLSQPQPCKGTGIWQQIICFPPSFYSGKEYSHWRGL